MNDRRLAFEILAVASALGAVAAALLNTSDVGDAAHDGGLVLMYVGVALVALSAVPVRHLRWRLVPYLLAAIVCWLIAWYIGVALVEFT